MTVKFTLKCDGLRIQQGIYSRTSITPQLSNANQIIVVRFSFVASVHLAADLKCAHTHRIALIGVKD